MSGKQWFSVRALFETVISSPPQSDYPFEERAVIVRADDEEDARRKVADRFSKNLSYPNTYGDTVQVAFREVLDVCSLFEDFTEEFGEVYYNPLTRSQLVHVRKSLSISNGRETPSKSTSRGSSGRRSVARRPTARKPAARKPAARKPAARKPTVRKPAARKRPTKK